MITTSRREMLLRCGAGIGCIIVLTIAILGYIRSRSKPPTDPPYSGPMLVPEPLSDLPLPEPIPSGIRTSPFTEGSYGAAGTGPYATTAIPVMPKRKPDRIVGDRRFLAPGNERHGIALSPDGKLLAMGTCIYEVDTGELYAEFNTWDVGGHKLQFSPDGRRLYSGGAVIDIPTKRMIQRFGGQWALTADAKQIACLGAKDASTPGSLLASYRMVINIYDTATWKNIESYGVLGCRPRTISISPDGSAILIGTDDGNIRIWDRKGAKEIATLSELSAITSKFHKPEIGQILFSPDGKTLVSVNSRMHERNPIQIAWWSWPDCKLIHIKDDSYGMQIPELTFSPDNQYLFIGYNFDAKVLKVSTGELVTEFRYSDSERKTIPNAAFISPNRIFTNSGRAQMYEFPSLKPVAWPEIPFNNVPKIDDFEIVSTVRPEIKGGTILEDGSKIQFINLMNDPDGGFIHSDAQGNKVRRYDIGKKGYYSVSPDDKVLATCTMYDQYGPYTAKHSDRAVRFYELATGNSLGEIRVTPQVYAEMFFSPDSKRIALIHADGIIRIWDVSTRKPLFAFDPIGYRVDKLRFSKNGKWLVGGNEYSPLLLLWDTEKP